MSSILDALKKVEQERARKSTDKPQYEPEPIGSKDLVDETVPARPGRTITVTPTTMVVGTITFGVVMVIVSVVVSLAVMLGSHNTSPGTDTTRMASAAPQTTPHSSPAKRPEDAARPVVQPSGVSSYAEATHTIEKRVGPAQKPASPSKPAPASIDQVASTPPAPAVVVPPAPVTPIVEPPPPETLVAANTSLSTPTPVAAVPQPVVPAPGVEAPATKADPKPADVTPPAPPSDESKHDEEVVAEQAVKAPAPPPKSQVHSTPNVGATKSPPAARKEPEPTQIAKATESPELRDPASAPLATSNDAVAAPLPDLVDAPRKPSGVINYNSLPRMSESERLRLGLPKLKINLVGLPTKNKPNPSALINLNKVYVGENIPSTNAKLIGVDLHGVAIEVDGHQYFLERGI